MYPGDATVAVVERVQSDEPQVIEAAQLAMASSAIELPRVYRRLYFLRGEVAPLVWTEYCIS